MKWLIAANHKKYNHDLAFKELDFIDWKQNANYEVGDKVYIYSSRPTSAIKYLVEVIKVDIKGDSIRNDKKYWIDEEQYESGIKKGVYARFKLIATFPTNLMTLKDLHDHGIKGNIQGPRKLYDNNGDLFEWANFILERSNVNEFEEDIMQETLLKESLIDIDKTDNDFEYSDEIKPKGEPVLNKGVLIYKRDKQTSLNALNHAHYKCEYDNEHVCFMRRDGITPYTEAHHLIPMKFQEEYNVSIDIEENIVSLCSHCHNEIHYGMNAKKLITKLYNDRIELLRKKGIKITLNKLLSYYKI